MNFDVEQSHRFLELLADHGGEYAGIPFPLEGEDLRVHPSYRFAQVFTDATANRYQKAADAEDPDLPKFSIVNSWRCRRLKVDVYVLQEHADGAKRVAMLLPTSTVFQYAMRTLGLVPVWKFTAELKAQEKLLELVTGHAFRSYLITGTFLETSKRSGVTYLFRRCRPTVAMREHKPGDVRPLCTLCLHPIGYYDKSYGGSLVPTDDVISHLLLMRGDEHAFWKLANQHPADAPQSDL